MQHILDPEAVALNAPAFDKDLAPRFLGPLYDGGVVYRSYQVRSTETDRCDRLQPEVLFGFLQEMAYDGSEVICPSQAEIDASGVCWILSRFTVRMDRLPVWRENIHLKTWLRSVDGVFFNRDFYLADDEGRIWGAATSSWFLASIQGHKPQRPSVLGDGLRLERVTGMEAAGLPKAPRFRLDKLLAGSEPSFHHSVVFTDLDRNGHVNNTRYIAIAMNAMVEAGLDPAVFLVGFDVNYVSEALPHGKIAVYVHFLDCFPLKEGGIQDACHVAVEGRNEEEAVIFSLLMQYLPPLP